MSAAMKCIQLDIKLDYITRRLYVALYANGETRKASSRVLSELKLGCTVGDILNFLFMDPSGVIVRNSRCGVMSGNSIISDCCWLNISRVATPEDAESEAPAGVGALEEDAESEAAASGDALEEDAESEAAAGGDAPVVVVKSDESTTEDELLAPDVQTPDQVLNRPGSAAGKPVRAFWDRPWPLESGIFPSFPFTG